MARSQKNLNAVFTDTANAIRAKKSSQAQISPLDFADEIASIPTGTTPSGTIELRENGSYNVKQYAEAWVDIPQYYLPGNFLKELSIAKDENDSNTYIINATIEVWVDDQDPYSSTYCGVWAGDYDHTTDLYQFTNYYNANNIKLPVCIAYLQDYNVRFNLTVKYTYHANAVDPEYSVNQLFGYYGMFSFYSFDCPSDNETPSIQLVPYNITFVDGGGQGS